MTAQSDLKKFIRDRQAKTGESYSTARAHVMRARAALLGLPEETAPKQQRVEAIVLKVNEESARVRVLGEVGELTFRCDDVHSLVPGHVATLTVTRRWLWHGDAYASGAIEQVRVDPTRLGLTPLPLSGGELEDLREGYEPFRRPDPYAPLWRVLTAKPRRSHEMDPIAWGQFPDADLDDNLTNDAADLRERGDDEGARRLLMEALHRDLRCTDAHAHLGNLEFDRHPERAKVYYALGIAIAELSLPKGFDGVLPSTQIHNRPFLRCLHGLGLCLWRLGQLREAQQTFERLLALDPNDGMGVRFCWNDVRNARSWEEAQGDDLAQ